MLSGQYLERYLMREVHGIEIPRKPPQRARKSRGSNYRSVKYLRWLRNQPCAACGITTGVQAAHTGTDGGIGTKPSDSSAIPLCSRCHVCGPDAYHRVGRYEFERRMGLNCAVISGRYFTAWSGGKSAT